MNLRVNIYDIWSFLAGPKLNPEFRRKGGHDRVLSNGIF